MANSNSQFLKRLTAFPFGENRKLSRDLIQQPSKFGLGQLPAKLQPDSVTTSVCGFCATGCGLKVHLKNNESINLTPDRVYPVNLGQACPKGWEALTPLKAKDRGTVPLIRDVHGTLKASSWDGGLKAMVSGFRSIADKMGPEALAFLSTGQICTEEMAMLGALCKFGMGMIHGDGNTRQCMATAVVAYKQSFGFDAPPYTYKDFEASDVIVFVGANPCINHPIMWERVCLNKNNPQIIVIDPRKTETAIQATRHYAINPKSDLTFFYGIANLLIDKGALDKHYITTNTEGFEAFKEHVKSYTTEDVCRTSGISVDMLHEFANLIAKGKRVSFWWTMGVNQGHEAVRTAQSIINIALMTGNMGRPGTGANSITGQTNAMGSRLFSNTTNLLGGRDFTNRSHREHVANLLGISVNAIPTENSLAYPEIFKAVEEGKIKGLWIIATNPAHSWIQSGSLEKIRKKLDFLVVQDMYYSTETAQLADVYLPAAGWGEKSGTVINSERRFGLYKKVAKAPGQALADFYIFKLVAQYWGCAELFKDWSSPEAVFQLMKKLSKGQPCDISGIKDYQMLDKNGGIQWPFKKLDAENMGDMLSENQRRLFSDGKFFTTSRKAKFIFETPRDSACKPAEKFPFIMITGRSSSAQWHTGTRTNKSPVLQKLFPSKDAYVEINPADARSLKIESGQAVTVQSANGKVRVVAWITPTVKPGEVFMPMHYQETNKLTFPDFDKYSRQPSYKFTYVGVFKS